MENRLGSDKGEIIKSLDKSIGWKEAMYLEEDPY
jgi:hypothetical protein